ncbi:uncharacterized protein LOC122455372 isoform X3 [Dermochelys coriacea]|uniref:uncharacterized protein LOC122455372 isoform X3 n=1 Tax=Dermochelys coriacea TaxID=27794 RepID=UPI001CA9B3F4|nr:uncharacterized protein LOC122455372 isoform X3 [Dermochelys coriacea]
MCTICHVRAAMRMLQIKFIFGILVRQSIQPNTWFGFLLKVNCKAKMKVELSKDCLPSQIRLWLAFSIEKITVEQNVLQIPHLTPTEINEMITYWLERDHRRLSSYQQQLLVKACAACPLPLCVFCAYKDSYLWTSFTPETEIYLPPNLSKMYSQLLDRMEKKHGEQVCKRMAAYITLSRNGIALEELLELLSLNDAVIQEITKYQKVSISVFPLVLWMKL